MRSRTTSIVTLVVVAVLLSACEAMTLDEDLAQPLSDTDETTTADAGADGQSGESNDHAGTDDTGRADGVAAAAPTEGAAPDSSSPGAPSLDSLPDLPDGWPQSVQLGMASGAHDAATIAATAPFRFRYKYLAGGVNTGDGWVDWNPDGAFVTRFVGESRDAGLRSVFTYYMLRQSRPGRDLGEVDGVAANLADPDTMAAYYRDLRLFFQRAGDAGGMTVLHLEPDLWAFMQQRATDDDATSVPVKVGASGMSDVSDLPDTAAGFAQAIVRLRDRYAANVVLGYHFSTWATGHDILHSIPSDNTVQVRGERTATFYRSLDAPFDIAFTDIADRDAAFKEEHYGDGGASWMEDADYARSAVYVGAFVETAALRAVLWQIPFGNTVMRAMNNTWGHYQDNKVETLLDQPDQAALNAYTDAGVVAYLFGGGAGGVTCACDAQGDGVTNPAPINGNDQRSLSADDDGGFFRDRAAAYYREGAIPLRSD